MVASGFTSAGKSPGRKWGQNTGLPREHWEEMARKEKDFILALKAGHDIKPRMDVNT